MAPSKEDVRSRKKAKSTVERLQNILLKVEITKPKTRCIDDARWINARCSAHADPSIPMISSIISLQSASSAL